MFLHSPSNNGVINASKRGKSLLFGFAAKQTKLFTLTNGRITSTHSSAKTQSWTMFQKTNVSLKCYIGAGFSARQAHTDLKWPDFKKYRRQLTKEPNVDGREGSCTKKLITYLPVAASLTASLYAAKTVATQLITSMSPSADVLAMAQAEIKLSSIAVGQMITVKWRGKPLFVKRRAPEDVEAERNTPLASLRDPERDEDRVIKAEWLVVIGVCTHLGCVPISNAGDYKAFYCPCHGSHYDHSGRIRKGPAPTNLEVPKYVFLNDNTLLVG